MTTPEDSNKPPKNQPEIDWEDLDPEPLPSDSPIFNGVLIFSPSVPTTSTEPSEPEQPEATSGSEGA
jgi:hypothetical protein